MTSKYKFQLITQEKDRCLQACLLMAIQALTGEPVTRPEMDRLTRFPGPEIGTWPYHAAVELAGLNREVVLHEAFNLSAFVADPQAYVREFYPGELGDEEARNPDLPNVVTDAKRLLEDTSVKRVPGAPAFGDLQHYVDDGYLAVCNTTDHVLRKLPFGSMHWVVVFECSPARVQYISPSEIQTHKCAVSREEFETIWSYPNPSARNILAIR